MNEARNYNGLRFNSHPQPGENRRFSTDLAVFAVSSRPLYEYLVFSSMTKKTPLPSFKGRLALGFFKLTGCLPLGLLRAIGTGLGWVTFAINGREAQVTRRNLELVYPDIPAEERERFAKQSLIETARTVMEMGLIWQSSQAWLRSKIVAVHGRELLDEKISNGKGVLVVAPHFGNWEVLGRYLGDCGPTTSLYQPPALIEVDPLIREGRERSGATLVPTDRRGVTALLKALKAGHTVGILPDQVPTQGAGEFAPFFGIPTLTMTLCHQLYVRNHSDYILGFAKRVTGGFEIIFAEPDAQIYSDDITTALTGLNKTVEACVAYEPTQYQWEYKRFRRQPDGGASPYKKN